MRQRPRMPFLFMGKFVDLTGRKFGRLSVIKRDEPKGRVAPHWVCKCDCGNITSTCSQNLKEGIAKSCGCLHGEIVSCFEDLTGLKEGRLLVHSLAYKKEKTNREKSYNYYWNCVCDCGTVTVINGTAIKNKITLSCGCLQKEAALVAISTHGQSNTRLYTIWCDMKSRCRNNKNDSYSRYGGRGIDMCDEWYNSFEAFYRDMLDGYADNLSVDRIENELGYFKGNCRWATTAEQNRNKRNNVVIEIEGEIMCLADWLILFNLTRDSVRQFKRKGYSWQESLLLAKKTTTCF